jgi:hypothetical protein
MAAHTPLCMRRPQPRERVPAAVVGTQASACATARPAAVGARMHASVFCGIKMKPTVHTETSKSMSESLSESMARDATASVARERHVGRPRENERSYSASGAPHSGRL